MGSAMKLATSIREARMPDKGARGVLGLGGMQCHDILTKSGPSTMHSNTYNIIGQQQQRSRA